MSNITDWFIGAVCVALVIGWVQSIYRKALRDHIAVHHVKQGLSATRSFIVADDFMKVRDR